MALLPRIMLNDATDSVARKKALAGKVEAAIFDEKEHPRSKDGKFDEATTAAKAVAVKAVKDAKSGVKNSTPPELARGQSSGDIGTLQGHLNDNYDAKLAVDGKFGPKTEAAVKAFQKLKGLKETGIVGLDTWKALGVETWHDEDEPPKRGSLKKSGTAKHNSKRGTSKKTSHSSSKSTSDSPAPSSEPKKSIKYILQRGGEREDA